MMTIVFKLLLLGLLPGAALGQTPSPVAPAASTWTGGFGVGNGLELHAGRWGTRLMAYGRLRGKWWRPASGPSTNWLGHDLNTRSRQVEAAALLGYPVAVGKALVYAAAGVAYVNGRELGEYRYTLRANGLVTSATHYYSYQDYQALGLPLEVGILTPRLGINAQRAGLSFQADLNPQYSVFCVLATLWLGGK